jgi:FSR family fosmidomycin resistance protein-like MFS transporter
MGMSQKTTFWVLFAISFVHLLNDSIQAVIPAIFPILKHSMHLSYFQIGLIGLFLNLTASVMQPVVGLYSDKKPSPFLLPIGMTSTFLGVLGLALAPQYAIVLITVIFIGLGSAVFHPEASKVTYLASGTARGLGQSIYQVGGNAGQGALFFTLVAGTAIVLQLIIARWYKTSLQHADFSGRKKSAVVVEETSASRRKFVWTAMTVLIVFVFARTWFHVGISSYYSFYLIDKFGLSIKQTQLYTFLFLAAGAVGTFAGGPISDKIGKKNTLMYSMLLSAPLSILLPHLSPHFAIVLMPIIGFIILSSFSVAVVYGQELLPGKVGMASGLIVGLAFGLGAIGSAVLGALSDWFGIGSMMVLISFIPLFGFIAIWLPSDQKLREWHVKS